MSDTTLYVGDVAPRSIHWDVAAGGDLTDLSIVTAVTVNVIYPVSREQASWTAVIESKSVSALSAKRALQASDLTKAGIYRTWLSLVTPIGTYTTTPYDVRVLAR